MIDIKQFQDLIIDPALEEIGMYSLAASELVLGTGIQESHLTYLVQLDGDDQPYDDAIGLFQMESATFLDLWQNWLRHRVPLAHTVRKMCGSGREDPTPEVMVYNLRFAAAMCRLHYRRVREGLPAAGDVQGQARYWKKYYNTRFGAGTEGEYIRNWEKANG